MKILFLMILSGFYLFLALSIDITLIRILFLAVAIWLFIWGYKLVRAQTDILKQQLQLEVDYLLKEYPHTEAVLADDYLSALLIDEESEIVYVLSRKTKKDPFQSVKFSFYEIFEAALMENDELLSIVAKGEKEKSIFHKKLSLDDEVQKISLKFLINNITTPEIEFVFFESDTSISKENNEYKEIMDICHEWFYKMSIIIKRSESIPIQK